MTGQKLAIDVQLCTFRRPEVSETLASLSAITIPDDVDLRIVVCDNDDTATARGVVDGAAAQMTTPVLYRHAPARNISIARNAGLDAATERQADWVAFLDDDEIVEPNWLDELLKCARATGADAIFGPSEADYGSDAPGWIRKRDYHSNRPERRDGIVQTGHTCNAFLKWAGTVWTGERFDTARGKSGGEDTEFFFRLLSAGAVFEICDTAVVREPVAPGRLSFAWLLRRKFRSGQSYAALADGPIGRVKMSVAALGKVGFCVAVALLNLFSQDRRNFWLLRAGLHTGVIAGCLSLQQPEIYGKDDPA